MTEPVIAAGRELLARWREPHRRYHDLAHLASVLDAIDQLEAATPPDITAGSATSPVVPARLAAWFHDAIYLGRPGHDEAASADLAVATLTRLVVPPPVVTEVGRLVRVTADHVCGVDDVAAATLIDADLAVLAGSPAAYRRYRDGVRAEYAHLEDADFRTGRAAVLRRLLANTPLFRTEAGRRLWQQAARENLASELALLKTRS